MPSDCLQTACRLPSDCLQTAFRLPADCLQTAFRLPADCLQTPFRLPADCLQTIFRLIWMCKPQNSCRPQSVVLHITCNYRFFNVVLFAMVCGNHCFTDVSVGCQGLFSDRGLLANTTTKIKGELILQPKNSHNKVQFTTGIKLRNISAMGCHLQRVFQNKNTSPAR